MKQFTDEILPEYLVAPMTPNLVPTLLGPVSDRARWWLGQETGHSTLVWDRSWVSSDACEAPLHKRLLLEIVDYPISILQSPISI